MEKVEKSNPGDDDAEAEEIATPKSHSVHWLAVLKKLNESLRSLKMDLDDLSLMELPEQVFHRVSSVQEHSFIYSAGVYGDGFENAFNSIQLHQNT
jgi:hypothetical protein